ncbi:TolC family protein [Enterobacteriaceae bacterium H20N1]|uniref:TolC family protein n=1 Tax=Dryocola boscaweniae TaxID=2925397 RepID=A0A9X2W9H6_9ENTR|nr:TolC family protein [Dryocola boscaweniae]MCT4703350.1 TolC family protein [Dryocola boscaweniae]MCT4720518.1 TolC family protein [Dryocola boscaweniae]
MKRFLSNGTLFIRGAGFACSLMIVIPYSTANADDFIELIRLTESHPSIQSALSSSNAAYFDIEQAKAATNLQMSAGISASGYSGQPGAENNPLSPHLSISKVLYDHGRTDAVVEGREATYNIQRAQIMVVRETINQQVLSLYTAALTNAKVVAVLDKEIAALNDLLQRVKNIAIIDSGRASEINQVSTRLSAIVASREMSYTNQQQALTQLSQLLNKDIALVNGLPELKKSGLLPASLAVAESSLQTNPSLVVARHKRDEALASVKLASKWNRPQWSVQLKMDSPRVNGEMEPFKAATLQLSSDMSLWDGGAGSSALKGETRRLSAAEQEFDATMRMLRQQLAQQWISLPLREKQIRALEQQTASAKKTWDNGQIQFFAGQRPLTDLISFVTDYYSGLASYEEQKVQYSAAQWQIVSSLGKMSDLAKKVKSLPGPALSATEKASISIASKTNNQTFNAINTASAVTSERLGIDEFKRAVDQAKTGSTPADKPSAASVMTTPVLANKQQTVNEIKPPVIPVSTAGYIIEHKPKVLFSSAQEVKPEQRLISDVKPTVIPVHTANTVAEKPTVAINIPAPAVAPENNSIVKLTPSVIPAAPLNVSPEKVISPAQSIKESGQKRSNVAETGKGSASQQILREWPW